MAILYPHRQTLFIVFVCAATIGATSWYVSRQNTGTKTEKNTAIETSTVVQTQDQPTSAVSDWREQFLNTEQKTGASTAKKSDKTEPLTLTDQIGRSFFTNYMYLRQGNLTTDNQAVQNAVDYTIYETANKAPQPKSYTISDIKKYSDDTSISLHQYGNNVAQIFSQYAPRTDSAVVAMSAFENDDMELLKSIDTIVSGYTKTISMLLETATPPSLMQQHLNLINGLSAMKYTSEGLRGGDKDPMQALIGISGYGVAQNTLQSALQNIKNILDSKNITFTSDEPGVAFLSISTSLR